MCIKKNNLSLAEKKQMACDNQQKNNKKFKEIIGKNRRFGLNKHIITLKRCFITCEDEKCNVTATEFFKCETCPGLDLYINNMKLYQQRNNLCNNSEII